MKSWKLKWIVNEFTQKGNYRKHSKVIKTPAKFYWALLFKLLPGSTKWRINFYLKMGGTFEVNHFMTLYIYKEIFVDGCYDIPKISGIKPNIVDVGANTGLFAIRMKQLYPDSNILCFEPYPPNFKEMQRNFSHSHLDQIQMLKKGVGDKKDMQKLFIHNKNIGGHSIYQELTQGSQYIEMELVDLSDIVKLLRGEPCDYLKLDCEGAEFAIIKSLDKTLVDKFPRIIFETTPSCYDLNEIVEHLQRLGYSVKKNTNNVIYIATLQT